MSTLDQKLAAAAADLRRTLGDDVPPPFVANRRRAPAALLFLLLAGIGVAGYATVSMSDDGAEITVAIQPEVPAISRAIDIDDPDQDQAEPNGITSGEDAPDDAAETPDDAVNTTTSLDWTSISPPESGQFLVPLPLAPAWSSDGQKFIAYRTGDGSPVHLVYDLDDLDATPLVLPFTPPDIEQIYWNPLNADQLLYADGPELWAFDVRTGESVVAHRFANCDSVDSGVVPVPPAPDGTVSLLCRSGSKTSQVVLNLANGIVQRTATESDTAAIPSPSGDLLVRWNDDDSASVLDRTLADTGRTLDIEGNSYGFVTDDNGREWIVTTLFDGPAVGTAVLLPLAHVAEPVVLIGPDRGDPYPPDGTVISVAGDKIAFSIRGDDDGLAGRITLLDLSEAFTDPSRRSRPHLGHDTHGYWSTPFVAVTRQGTVVYSTDNGGDTVSIVVGAFSSTSEPSD